MDQNTEHKVSFAEEEFKRPTFNAPSGTSRLAGMVIKYSGGIVANEKHAMYVVIGFVAFALIFSLFLILSGPEKNTPPPKIMDDDFNPTIRN